MSARTLESFDRTLKWVWRNTPRKEVEQQGTSWILDPTDEQERLDPEWWEPVSRWRRETAEYVAEFGGERYGKPAAPVEGPNNPNRLRRELEEAERDLDEAKAAQDRATAEKSQAAWRIAELEGRLA